MITGSFNERLNRDGDRAKNRRNWWCCCFGSVLFSKFQLLLLCLGPQNDDRPKSTDKKEGFNPHLKWLAGWLAVNGQMREGSGYCRHDWQRRSP